MNSDRHNSSRFTNCSFLYNLITKPGHLWDKRPELERCPHFRGFRTRQGVLIRERSSLEVSILERFHCTKVLIREVPLD